MKIDRKGFLASFTKSSIPAWPCPNCGNTSLALDRKSLTTVETAASIRAREHDAWEPEWITERFAGVARCVRDECREAVVLSGTVANSEYYTSDGPELAQEFTAAYVYPPVPLFPIPTDCPDELETEIKNAFALFWIDHEACANRIRRSIELLLTVQGIPRKRLRKFNSAAASNQGRSKTGRSYETLKLHTRLEVFGKRRPDIGDELMAVKWLGNVGSHSGDLSKDDLFDAFDILGHVLEELIGGHTRHVTSIARQINKRKGPRLSKRRKA